MSLIPKAGASNVLSSVVLPGGANRGQATFLSKDPVFNAYPTYLLQAGKHIGTVASVGVNLPAVDSGVLPDVGNLIYFYFYYAVPSSSPTADPGLQVVMQTSDGFSRIATGVSQASGLNANGFNSYYVFLYPTDVTPPFDQGTLALRKVDIKYYGTSQVQRIYEFYPFVSGTNGSLQYFQFNYKTNPDSAFSL
jgi:hypothetical protein